MSCFFTAARHVHVEESSPEKRHQRVAPGGIVPRSTIRTTGIRNPCETANGALKATSEENGGKDFLDDVDDREDFYVADVLRNQLFGDKRNLRSRIVLDVEIVTLVSGLVLTISATALLFTPQCMSSSSSSDSRSNEATINSDAVISCSSLQVADFFVWAANLFCNLSSITGCWYTSKLLLFDRCPTAKVYESKLRSFPLGQHDFDFIAYDSPGGNVVESGAHHAPAGLGR